MSYTLESYGGGVAIPDNTGAWNKMIAAIGTSNVSISLGDGRYTFLSSVSIILSPSQAVSIVGTGKGVTQLYFPASDGLTINYNADPWCRSSIHNLSIIPGSSTQHVGLFLNLPAPISSGNPALSATSDLENIAIGNLGGCGEWLVALKVDGVSNVDYNNVEIYGLGNSTSTIGVWLLGTSAVPVVHNFRGLNSSFLGVGFIYGDQVQGVTILGSNFTGCYTCIWIPPGTNLFQLTVTDCQFNHANWGILDQGPVGGMSIKGNLFLIGPGGVGMGSASPGPNIIGNEFCALGANTNGVVLNSDWAMVSNNMCVGLTTGIWLQQNAKNCSLSHNRGDGIANVIVFDQGASDVLMDNV